MSLQSTHVQPIIDIQSQQLCVTPTGTMVRNLKHLKLSNSIIATVRDLGTSLENLRVLWLSRCCLCDLDGMGSMSSLQVKLPPFWFCSLYPITLMNAKIHGTKRNQTIFSFQPRFGYIDLNGRKLRWSHHDKGVQVLPIKFHALTLISLTCDSYSNLSHIQLKCGLR